jgi:hypothetical protein
MSDKLVERIEILAELCRSSANSGNPQPAITAGAEAQVLNLVLQRDLISEIKALTNAVKALVEQPGRPPKVTEVVTNREVSKPKRVRPSDKKK